MGKIISFSGHGVVVVGMSWHVGSGLRGQGTRAGSQDFRRRGSRAGGLVRSMINILAYTSIVMIGLALHHLSPTSLLLASYLRFCLFLFPVSLLSSMYMISPFSIYSIYFICHCSRAEPMTEFLGLPREKSLLFGLKSLARLQPCHWESLISSSTFNFSSPPPSPSQCLHQILPAAVISEQVPRCWYPLIINDITKQVYVSWSYPEGEVMGFLNFFHIST